MAKRLINPAVGGITGKIGGLVSWNPSENVGFP